MESFMMQSPTKNLHDAGSMEAVNRTDASE